jgi:hypothetical protein
MVSWNGDSVSKQEKIPEGRDGSDSKLVLVGQRKAVAIAVRNASGRRRWSKLREWLGFPSAALIAIEFAARCLQARGAAR